MKNIIKFLFGLFILLGYSGSSWATCICIIAEDGTEYCDTACVYHCDTGTGYKSTPRLINNPGGPLGSDACIAAVTALETAELAKAEYSGGGCSVVQSLVPDNCTMDVMHICCSSTFVTAAHKIEVTTAGHTTVTGVPFGGESEAAQLAFNAFSAAHGYAGTGGTGLVRTDGLEGYAYMVSQGPGGNDVSVDVDMWKRGVYAPEGSTATIESIAGGSGGGGGGLTQEQLTAGMSSSLNTAGLTASILKTKMDDAFDRAHTNGYFPEGITAVGVQNGVKAALDDKFPDSSGNNSVVNWNSDFYVPTHVFEKEGVTEKGFATAFGDFSTNMKTTGLYGLGAGFFGNVPTSASSSIIDIDGGTTFGMHYFDFTIMSPWLLILKSVILIAFSFVAVKIVMINKG